MAASSRNAGGKTRLASANDLEPFLIEAFPWATTVSMTGWYARTPRKGSCFNQLNKQGGVTDALIFNGNETLDEGLWFCQQQSMVNFTRLAVSSALTFTLSSQVLASETRLIPAEASMQTYMRTKLPEFRIIKSIEPFAERYNASIELNVVTTRVEDGQPLKSLVTLYEGTTGEPLESCHTPCVLHKEPGRMVHIFAYRNGHLPLIRTLDLDPSDLKLKEPTWNGVYELSMGPDYRRAQFKRLKCERTFAREPKTDRDAVPCYRSPPFVPQIDFSGYCNMGFDVSNKGDPTNIKVLECTDPIFELPSRMAVSSWKYHPKIERGVAVSRKDVETKMRFDITSYDGRLLDQDGKPVPE